MTIRGLPVNPVLFLRGSPSRADTLPAAVIGGLRADGLAGVRAGGRPGAGAAAKPAAVVRPGPSFRTSY
jgi:hypothetical protein